MSQPIKFISYIVIFSVCAAYLIGFASSYINHHYGLSVSVSIWIAIWMIVLMLLCFRKLVHIIED